MSYANIVSAIALQKYCYRHGLQFFMALSSTNALEKVIFVSENFNDLRYDKFKKEFAK